MPETQLHLDLRTLLYHLLSDHLGEAFTVGSDQFVYWDASDPRVCIAPDAYVAMSPAGAPVKSWKTWERGAPAVAVEIASDSDLRAEPWASKLARYQALGVRELVRLDVSGVPGSRLRLWNRETERLTERVVEGERAASQVLDLTWIVAPMERYEIALRFEAGEPAALVPTRLEARIAETEARRAAEARVAALEAALRLRGR